MKSLEHSQENLATKFARHLATLYPIEQIKACVSASYTSLSEWAVKTPIILDGKPFTYNRHEYLRVPYEDTHPYQVEMKAAQLGLTTKGILRSIYGARQGKYKGILYLFPNKTDVTEFSKGRVTPMIEDNPESIGQWLRDTDAANIKRIWNTVLYLRGMQSRVGLKSIPVDFIAFDEMDEAPQNAVDMALERMSHSEIREILMLSNPTLPDYGIDAQFQLTDQRYWLIQCKRCRHWTCLEDTFPDCLQERKNGEVVRACEKCTARLDPSNGEWVAKRPSIIDRRGYHYSQLFSHFVSPAEILHKYRTTKNLQDFYNLKLGMPYVEAQNRLSVQEILALCSDYGIASEDPGPCSMGVDQGNDLHVVIGKKDGRILHLGVYKEWSELDSLVNNFNVHLCVVDGLPEQRNARDFAHRHEGKVFLNYYNEHQKGEYKWNERDFTVVCNRTESLDASHKEIQLAQVMLPREVDIVRTFAQHLHNVAKKLEEDEETGSKRYVYVKLGEDHFRHAYNYEAMARQSLTGCLLPELDPTRHVI